MDSNTDYLNLPFADRKDAGCQLAKRLQAWKNHPSALVLALPRGGVPVAWQVAHALGLPLDVLIVRKLGYPGYPELAVGAIASGGAIVINPSVAASLSNPEAALRGVIDSERRELHRRENLYRGDRQELDVRGKTVILIDDGLATGATMRAAAQAVKSLGAAHRVAAAPVGSHGACEILAQEVDDVVCAHVPKDFRSVGAYYEDFTQTTDQEVRDLLSRDPVKG
jgi:putative phosphoribosyl transferase